MIYLELLTLALSMDGWLSRVGVEDSITAELALQLNEDEELVEVLWDFLVSGGLVEEQNDTYFLPQAVAMVGSESDSAERVRKHRDKKKTLQCNTTVTDSNTEIPEKCNRLFWLTLYHGNECTVA